MRHAAALLLALLAACAPRPPADAPESGVLQSLRERGEIETQDDLYDALRGLGYLLRVRPLSTPVAFPTSAVSEFAVEEGPSGRRTGEFLQIYTFPTAEAAAEVGGRVQGRTPPLSTRTVFQRGRLVVLTYTARLRPSTLRDDVGRLLREDDDA